MHTNQTYNSLVVENLASLNWPDEIKEFIPKIKELNWTCIGLPAFDSKFTINNQQLYFESGPDDEVRLRKEEFTGETTATCVVTPESHDKVYILAYSFIFSKGLLIEHKNLEMKTDSRINYDKGFNEYLAKTAKMGRIVNSWWFKWLYVPYAMIVSGIASAIVVFVQFLLSLFVGFVDRILPIKFQ